MLSNPSTSRILLSHSLSIIFFGRENAMVNESNPMFDKVLLYISGMAFHGGPLGWYWVWKKSGAVSELLWVGFGFVVEPRSMLEPASSKMAAMVAVLCPRLMR
jgi:hypothetical protein